MLDKILAYDNLKSLIMIITAGLLMSAASLNAAGRIAPEVNELSKKIKAISDEKLEYGKKIAEFTVGTEENQIGLLRSADNAVPYGMFNGPSSFFMDNDEVLYVVDCVNHKVTVFDGKKEFSFIKSINYFTDKEHVSLITDIFAAKDGSVYLADTKNKSAVKFSSLGMPEMVFGAPVKDKFNGLKQADEISADNDGNVYVRDYSQEKIFKFSPDGKFAGEMNSNSCLYFNKKNENPMYQFDAESKSWKLYFEKSGVEITRFIHEIKKESPEQNMQIIGLDKSSNIYVKIFKQGKITVLKLSSEGKLLAEYKGHNDPGFDMTRYFFVNPVKETVYAVRYNKKNIEINELR
ncbi:MAG: hypothetical protein QMC67_13365 [Candidatus Wallbacteria bacterium]